VVQRRFSDFSRERFSDHGVRDCFRLAIAFPNRHSLTRIKDRRLSLATPEFGEGGNHPGSKKAQSVSEVPRETKPGGPWQRRLKK